MTEERPSASVDSYALQIAQMWALLPPEHLEVGLRALEPQLKREQEVRMESLRQKQREKQNSHIVYLCGLGAGFAIAVAMLGAAVFVGVNNQPWLAALLLGPSLLALAKLFVMQKSDAADLKRIAEAEQIVLNRVES